MGQLHIHARILVLIPHSLADSQPSLSSILERKSSDNDTYLWVVIAIYLLNFHEDLPCKLWEIRQSLNKNIFQITDK